MCKPNFSNRQGLNPKAAGGTTLRISIFCRVDLQLLEDDKLCNDE